VEILWWLAPAAVVTVAAMLWVAWASRPRRDDSEEKAEAAYRKFAQAIEREHPATGYARPPSVHDRSTGIAVRPSRRTD
jgi:flagellar biosynthesis/type III secretory pathway M-ring protein FliF/YscJ